MFCVNSRPAIEDGGAFCFRSLWVRYNRATMPEAFWGDRNIYRQPIDTASPNPNRVAFFAETDARNKKIPFGIKARDRSRHLYVIGKTGMGKSTLLENLAIQDIRNGEGLCFIDPHGKTADLLLEYVPEERVKDVLYFAPFDTEYPLSFNVMEDVGEDKRHLVVSGLLSAFKKIWGEDTFSARMEYILGNTLHALIEYPEATLLGINRMYTDKNFRKKVVDNITDTSVKAFWEQEFAGYTDRFAAEATPAIQNKIGQFTSNPLIRNIIGQPKSSFDLRKLMDEGKVIIVNLSKGRVGETNANLLGSMLITKLYLAAMSRADVGAKSIEKLPDFYLYVDEFQSFANESFADILSEARKYKLNLTIAHQYMAQMSDEVRDAVIGNVGTMVTFRIGAYDAEILEKEFQPTFTMEDMVNLGFTQIYLKLMIDGVTSQPFSAVTLPPIELPEVIFRDQLIESSRTSFARSRGEVEKEIKEWVGDDVKLQPNGGERSNQSRGNQRGDRRKRSNDRREPSKKDADELRAHIIDQEKSGENPFVSLKVGDDGTIHKQNTETASLKQIEAARPPKRGQAPSTKGPSPKNMSVLKETLSSVLSNKKNEENELGNNEKPQDKRQDAKSSNTARKSGPKEIPQEQLEQMLKVEE